MFTPGPGGAIPKEGGNVADIGNGNQRNAVANGNAIGVNGNHRQQQQQQQQGDLRGAPAASPKPNASPCKKTPRCKQDHPKKGLKD